jgi:hypothetical protein
MQPHDSDGLRPKEEPVDRGWDDEWSSLQGTLGVDPTEVADLDNRAVCLSANLSGKGGAAA